MFDSTPDLDFIFRDSGVPVVLGLSELGFGIVDDKDDELYDPTFAHFIGNLTKVTTKTAAFTKVSEGDLFSFGGGVYRVVITKLTNDGEICESLVSYQEPDIVTEAQVRAIVATMCPPFVVPKTTDKLQDIVNAMPASGGIISLGLGTYYGDPDNPQTPLVIPNTKAGIAIIGMGQLATTLGSPVLFQNQMCGLSNLWVKTGGAAYGVKIYNGGNFVSRCFLDKVTVGATFQFAGDGSSTGIQLDGAGLLIGNQLTVAFNTGNGLLVDSTGAQPNTTLLFNNCSFVQNGGYGADLEGSCALARFVGGAFESNFTLGGSNAAEVKCNNMNNPQFIGVDFETIAESLTPNAQLWVVNCNPVRVDDCTFVTGVGGGSSKASRAILMQGCSGANLKGNRFDCTSGSFGDVGVVRIAEDCVNCHVAPNQIAGGLGWIEDYSR